jgi:hypothetical protein
LFIGTRTSNLRRRLAIKRRDRPYWRAKQPHPTSSRQGNAATAAAVPPLRP